MNIYLLPLTALGAYCALWLTVSGELWPVAILAVWAGICAARRKG